MDQEGPNAPSVENRGCGGTNPAGPAEGCGIAEGVPGCDSGPVGRLRFVIREARAAWARRRATMAPDFRKPHPSSSEGQGGYRR